MARLGIIFGVLALCSAVGCTHIERVDVHADVAEVAHVVQELMKVEY
jgi:hypothetical protein